MQTEDLVTWGHITQACYECEAKYPEEENVKTTMSSGMPPRMKRLLKMTPPDVIQHYARRDNSNNTAARMSFTEVFDMLPNMEDSFLDSCDGEREAGAPNDCDKNGDGDAKRHVQDFWGFINSHYKEAAEVIGSCAELGAARKVLKDLKPNPHRPQDENTSLAQLWADAMEYANEHCKFTDPDFMKTETSGIIAEVMRTLSPYKDSNGCGRSQALPGISAHLPTPLSLPFIPPPSPSFPYFPRLPGISPPVPRLLERSPEVRRSSVRQLRIVRGRRIWFCLWYGAA